MINHIHYINTNMVQLVASHMALKTGEEVLFQESGSIFHVIYFFIFILMIRKFSFENIWNLAHMFYTNEIPWKYVWQLCATWRPQVSMIPTLHVYCSWSGYYALSKFSMLIFVSSSKLNRTNIWLIWSDTYYPATSGVFLSIFRL